jgi:hypothetical protein
VAAEQLDILVVLLLIINVVVTACCLPIAAVGHLEVWPLAVAVVGLVDVGCGCWLVGSWLWGIRTLAVAVCRSCLLMQL